MPLNPQPVPATTNHTPMDTNSTSKPELLPANLVDLTVRKAIKMSENQKLLFTIEDKLI